MYDFVKDNDPKLSTNIQEKYLTKKYKSNENFLKSQTLGRPSTCAPKGRRSKKLSKGKLNADIFNKPEAPNIDNLFPKTSSKSASKHKPRSSFAQGKKPFSKPESSLINPSISHSNNFESEAESGTLFLTP